MPASDSWQPDILLSVDGLPVDHPEISLGYDRATAVGGETTAELRSDDDDA